MATIEAVVPGWAHMASFNDGVTMRHTTAALVSIFALSEYVEADEHDRWLIEWAVLLHDLAKEPVGGRDHRHAVRSAAQAGRVLRAFGAARGDEARFEEWFHLADTAYTADRLPDNDKLPGILAGADRLFGRDAALIIKAITLHLSITVVDDWPVPRPLTPEEERRYVDADLAPLLQALMQADNGGWNLFDEPTLSMMLRQTRARFAELQ